MLSPRRTRGLPTRRPSSVGHHRSLSSLGLAATSLIALGCFAFVYMRHLNQWDSLVRQEPSFAVVSGDSLRTEQKRELHTLHSTSAPASKGGGHSDTAVLTINGGEPSSLASHESSGSKADSGQDSSKGSLSAPPLPPLPALTETELNGGWHVTQEIFDRATKHPNATVVSWSSPRVVLIKDFLAPHETEHLMAVAEGGFTPSATIAGGATARARDSSGVWLSGERSDAKVIEIQDRIADVVGIPSGFAEPFYMLRYELGQKYDLHTDHCARATGQPGDNFCRGFMERAGGPACGTEGAGVTCGDRLATSIIYLRSPLRGGATVFPKATQYITPHAAIPGSGDTIASRRSLGDQLGPSESKQQGQGQEGTPADAEVPDHCQEGAPYLQVAPQPGTAVFFWDYVPAGSDWQLGAVAPDPASEHGSCPVLSGEKFVVSRWFRSRYFV